MCQAHERSVAGKYDGKFGVTQCAARYLHGVTGAVLRLLQNGGHLIRGDGGGDFFGLVADDDNGLFRAQGHTGAEDLFDESAAAGAMQNFCEAGFQAGAFTGGENDYGKIFVFHRYEAQFVGAGRNWQCGRDGIAANY